MIDSTFLPPPRIPFGALSSKLPAPELLDGLVEGAGDGVVRARAIGRETVALIDAVEAARPGGAQWRDAMLADSEQFSSGKAWPKRCAVELLLDGDLNRWSRASAAARTMAARRDAALNESRATPGLVGAAKDREAAARLTLTVDAMTAWERASTRRTEDKPAAWKAYEAAREASAVCAQMRAVVAWVGGESTFDPSAWGAGWDPVTAGFMLATEDVLEGRKRLVLPKGVTWPRGHDAPSMMLGRTSTDIINQGYAELPDDAA